MGSRFRRELLAYIFVYSIIITVIILIMLTFAAVIVRRFYMERRYRRLDEERERYSTLSIAIEKRKLIAYLGPYLHRPGAVQVRAQIGDKLALFNGYRKSGIPFPFLIEAPVPSFHVKTPHDHGCKGEHDKDYYCDYYRIDKDVRQQLPPEPRPHYNDLPFIFKCLNKPDLRLEC